MFSFPPTPTPIATAGAPLVNMPAGVGLWDSSGEVIGLWNSFSQYTPIVQIFIILGVVVAAVFIAMKIISALQNEDSADKQPINVTVKAPTYKRRRRR